MTSRNDPPQEDPHRSLRIQTADAKIVSGLNFLASSVAKDTKKEMLALPGTMQRGPLNMTALIDLEDNRAVFIMYSTEDSWFQNVKIFRTQERPFSRRVAAVNNSLLAMILVLITRHAARFDGACGEGIQHQFDRPSTREGKTGDIRSWSYQQFLFKTVLHVYWPRIRRLDILIRPSLVETYNEGWCAIYQPAPYLEEFFVRFSTFYNEEPTDTSDAKDDETEHVIHSPPGFFGGEAPLLRSFSCPSIHDFDLSAPWLVNLCHLLFGRGGKDEKVGIPLATFLGTLDNIKNLETLQISTAYLVVPDDPRLPLPTAHLPRLLDILLEPQYSLKGLDTLLMDICLLKHLRPAPGCGLRVHLRERSNFLPQIRDLLHESLAMHSKNWFDVGMGRAPLTLHLDKYLGIIIAHQFSDWDQGRRFSVTVQDANYDHPEYLLFVLDAFSSCKFSTITRLKLKLDKEVYWTNSHVQSFIATLSNIQVLGTDVETLDAMTAASNNSPELKERVPFPILAKLQLEKYFGRKEGNAVEEVRKQFSELRTRMGYPVTIIGPKDRESADDEDVESSL
ncbi:hypothetical protein NLJ89_g7233 [Agrocybe chaxingu]|uniref:Uncharacterized protein n=1 Tax=Agrocybe chaxingu TaxID=84603 RepID=A0A9W8JXK9_9AGAR|nr:hypothetical protein NLJ89_g7233 [Agrocybe chaxingu]